MNFGRTRYFHHHRGSVYLNRRSRFAGLFAGIILTAAGGFFIFSGFILPTVRHAILLQKQHSVSINPKVLAEPLKKGVVPDTGQHTDYVLNELIKEKLATYPSGEKWSVFLYDFNNGGSVKINQDEIMPAASLYKLFLLEALESKLPFDNWAYTWTSDGTNIQDCVQKMLQKSDSACAESLSDYIGWGVVDRLNQKNGFTHTKVAGIEGRQTTAADVGEFLIRLKKGQTLSDKARRFVFDALYQQVENKGISAGCNSCRTADKIGELTGVANDAGIVTHGDHSYALVILSQGGTLKQVADITKTIEQR